MSTVNSSGLKTAMKIASHRRAAPMLAVALLALATALAHAHEPARTTAEPAGAAARAQDQFLTANPKLSVIARAPEFTLHDTLGEQIRLSDYRGRAVLLAFIFTSCKSACPLISQQMATLQGELKRAALFPAKAGLLSVTVDPQIDTAEILARYAKNFGADPAGWRFLYDGPEQLKVVLAAYDEWTKALPGGGLDHPARVYLIDPQGNIREVYSLAFFNERQAYLDIRALLREKL
jgi:protein SCO1/2